MHGRLKVRTTVEQEERKKIEREKKLKLYKFAMGECLNRYKNLQLDDTLLKTTEEILTTSGDIQTLWNIRKKTIDIFEKEKTHEEETIIKYYATEMAITEQCLRKNPKSYSCWHHRRWCLTRSNNLGYGSKNNELNWEHELKLCSNFLILDERNFHCWRHRSFVIEAGGLSKLNELEFTYEKICSNFSNYSAWHYRSKLIEHLYKENQIDLNIFKNELNLIEQALFTDPNDQSAWIYEKWLLIEHQRSDIRELLYHRCTRFLSFKFSKPVNILQDVTLIKLNGEDLLNSVKWTSDDSNSWKGELLTASLADQSHIKIEICFKNSGIVNELVLERDIDSDEFIFRSKFEIINLAMASELILNHLKNIMELSELEEEKSKWCLLTLVELMSSLDLNKYKDRINKYLDMLADQVDAYRKNYYLDLKRKITSSSNN